MPTLTKKKVFFCQPNPKALEFSNKLNYLSLGFVFFKKLLVPDFSFVEMGILVYFSVFGTTGCAMSFLSSGNSSIFHFVEKYSRAGLGVRSEKNVFSGGDRFYKSGMLVFFRES